MMHKKQVMKTFKLIVPVLLWLTVSQMRSQIGDTYDLGSPMAIEKSMQSFKMVSESIAADKNFNYRSELRESKYNHTLFYFKDTTLSKARVLRHFKKAARRSDNSIQFKNYFLKRQLHFINTLDRRTLSGVYDTMRSNTLNGYLDIWAVLVGTDRMVPAKVPS